MGSSLDSPPNREIVFVSFVRACERSCVCPRDDVASVAGLRKLEQSSAAWRGRACRVPSLPFAVAATACRPFPWLPVPSRAFPLRSRCFPLRSRCFPRAPRARINANLCVWAPGPVVSFCSRCFPLLIHVNSC